MSASRTMIRIVDDEPATRTALERLLRAAGYRALAFASSEELLLSDSLHEPGCLLLDVHMPAMNGIELQEALSRTDVSLPIIFLTCHGNIPMSVRAMKSGAVDFLTKPVDKRDLLLAIQTALQLDTRLRKERAERCELEARLSTLTPREGEVFARVVDGKLNKQIAAELGTGEQNIKIHRGHLMRKMQVQSVADLVKLAERLGISRGFSLTVTAEPSLHHASRITPHGR